MLFNITNAIKMDMDRLLFGTAGIPRIAKGKGIEEGIRAVKRLGLDAMELEFVRGVWMGEERAREVGAVAKRNGITLTAHAPYYINLLNPEKREKSINFIKRSARVLQAAGGYSLVFHAGYYGRVGKREANRTIAAILQDLCEDLSIWIRPETTGKHTQWGTLEEVLEVSQEVECVLPCIDFAHIHARSFGAYNTRDGWRSILERVEEALGKEGL